MTEQNKKMSLIEISGNIERIILDIMESGGEVSDESFVELEAFRGKLEDKGAAIGYVIKSVMESRIDRLKAIKKQADEKLRIENNAQERLKSYLKKAMIATDTKKIEGDLYNITLIAPKEKLKVVDENKTPAKYITIETVQTIDYKAITDDLKSGVDVPGYELQDGEHGLMIK
jgi:hypothetical protein